MIEDIFKKIDNQLKRLLSLCEEDLKAIKTGRAKPSLVENIQIEAYQTKMSLKELASISAPDPHSLIINPWDKNLLETISKGIAQANLNLNPIVDNDLIRLKIPPLTEETRKELVRLVKQKIESFRRMLRQIRNDAKNEIENLKDEGGVSEDNIKEWLGKMQNLIDETGRKLENLGTLKEEELLSF